MHLGVLTVPVAGVSEFEVHRGNEVINVLKGEKMFIPAGGTRQYLNFTNDPVKAYIAVAPGL